MDDSWSDWNTDRMRDNDSINLNLWIPYHFKSEISWDTISKDMCDIQTFVNSDQCFSFVSPNCGQISD